MKSPTSLRTDRPFRFWMLNVGTLSLLLCGIVSVAKFAMADDTQVTASTPAISQEGNAAPGGLPTEAEASVDTSGADVTPVDPASLKYFESHVRPLLIEKCQKCHGAEKQMGGLRLDGRSALLRGGESGAAAVPHQPGESLIIEAINFESFEMPPDGKMADEQIAILTKWISDGAVWPGEDITANLRQPGKTFSEEDLGYWCFQPMERVSPPTHDGDQWSRTPIDRFIFAKLQEHKLQPRPEADRLVLLRRVTQSLTGLPPTLEEIDAYLADDSPEAYARVVQRLLDSPAHGEHMAQFWLDIVRYGESDGYRQDAYRPNAWRYRDYVIKSFNNDKPYDRFVMEQLAGDEIAPADPDALAATGYLRHGIYEYNQRDAETQWKTMLEDITDTTSDVFLGLGMGCAKCHDHKFDPILQADYYRLQSFFANVAFRDDVPLATPDELATYNAQLEKWELATAKIRTEMESLVQAKKQSVAKKAIEMFSPEIRDIMAKSHIDRTAYERQIAQLVQWQVDIEEEKVPGGLKDKAKERWEELQTQLKEFDSLKPAPLQFGPTITDISPTPSPVFIPGKQRLGEITPGFLAVLDQTSVEIPRIPAAPESSGRRTALAQWLTNPEHPLTARVIVNRIWQQHFGTGLVSSPSDFGRLGDPPSHPELLDWLATEFINQGWSLKWLHREITMSQSFRQQSESGSNITRHPTLFEDAKLVDPANRFLWKFPTRRLNGEQIRDAALAISGELKQRTGGAGSASSATDRSVYLKVIRNNRDELLSALDFPDRLTSAGTRSVTTTPTQALLLINGDWGLKRAGTMAKRLEASGPTDESRVTTAYRLAYGRDPSEEEIHRGTQFLQQQPRPSNTRTPPPFPFDQMPITKGRSLSFSGDPSAPLPSLAVGPDLKSGHLTIETTLLLRSLYPDATVRTIVSQWDADTTHPGWSLGVTSTKSAFKPRNLILQFVGNDTNGKLLYEVVPSNLHLELDRPYRIVCSINFAETQPSGVTFTIQDLSDPSNSPQTAQAAHRVVGGVSGEIPVLIGGRVGGTRHRWDGLVDELALSSIVPSSKPETPPTVTPFGRWDFENSESPWTDLSHAGNSLQLGEPNKSSRQTALIDFCHILLNSNEFLYLD